MLPRVIECVILNNEIDLLEERLYQSYDCIDLFVIVESEQTFSSNKKPLSYLTNEHKFLTWKDKIRYFVCPSDDKLKLWQYEWFQRNYIVECLKELNCTDEDIIFISDVDEFININNVLKFKDKIPFRFETAFYYYFSNLKTFEIHNTNICVYWKDIKDIFIGNRELYLKIFPEYLPEKEETKFGKHLSYMFGYDIEKYQNKISSFSHSEYNNYYYKNPIRLKYLINAKKDIFERSEVNYEITKPQGFITVGLQKHNSYYSTIVYTQFAFIIKFYIFLLRNFYFLDRRTRYLIKRLPEKITMLFFKRG